MKNLRIRWATTVAETETSEIRYAPWRPLRLGARTAWIFEMDERHSTYEGGQDIRDRTFAFACRIVAFCGKLYQIGGVARMMVPQLLNCGTSPYAQMEEARAAESDRDFVSKCAVGYKEIREAHGRLRIHEACDIGPREEAASLRGEANQLVAIIGTIIRNKRRNAGLTRRKRPKKPDA